MVRRSELSEVLLAESPSHTSQGLRHLGLKHAHLLSERGILLQLPLEPIVSCPCESDPSFHLRHNVGACVDKAALVQKLHRLHIPMARCFDDER